MRLLSDNGSLPSLVDLLLKNLFSKKDSYSWKSIANNWRLRYLIIEIDVEASNRKSIAKKRKSKMALREQSSSKCYATAKGWKLSPAHENIESSLPTESSSRWNKCDGKSLWLTWTKRTYFIKICWKRKRTFCEDIGFGIIVGCSKRIGAQQQGSLLKNSQVVYVECKK